MQFKKDILSSPANPKVKRIISLRRPEWRKKSQTFIIEGYPELKQALTSAVSVSEVYFYPAFFTQGDEPVILAQAKKRGAALFEVNARVYERISFGKRKEGILAIARQLKISLDGLKLKDNPLFVVLEQIEKPGNLGAVIRTADAVGVDAVIACDSATDIYNPNVVRSSLGALFTTPVISLEAQKTISWLKVRNIKIICATVGAELIYTSVNFKQPCAIVLGSEENGLSLRWRESSDYQVGIPMQGKVDSLNVSVAAGVILFEALRQRMN